MSNKKSIASLSNAMKPSILKLCKSIHDGPLNVLSTGSVTLLQDLTKHIIKIIAKHAKHDTKDKKDISDKDIIRSSKKMFTGRMCKDLNSEMSQFINDHVEGTESKDLDLIVKLKPVAHLLQHYSKKKPTLYAEIAITALVERLLDDIISSAGSFEKEKKIFPKDIKLTKVYTVIVKLE